MNLIKRMFGGKGEKEYVDKYGLYFYVQCDNCGSKVQVRADRQHDLNRTDGGFVWHKTIVDSHCFRQIPVVVHLDAQYRVTEQEIDGGRFISQLEYEATRQ
jgi:hypothetical protein